MPEWLIAVFTIALISVAVAQIVFLRQQVEFMRKAYEHIREGLAQAEITAQAASSVAGTAKLALEISARANIAIESVTLVDPRPEGNRRITDRAARSCVEVTIKNYGATPAKDLRYEFAAQMTPYIEEPVFISGQRPELHSQCTARPTFKSIRDMCSEFYRDADVNLCLDDLVLKGRVRYKDIFGNGYSVECAARFDPVAWQFETATDAQAGYSLPSGSGNAAVAARVGDNGH